MQSRPSDTLTAAKVIGSNAYQASSVENVPASLRMTRSAHLRHMKRVLTRRGRKLSGGVAT
jgi:hypothetical protein